MRVKPRQPVSSELRWYALLWGPWFLLGGVLFLLAVRSPFVVSALAG